MTLFHAYISQYTVIIYSVGIAVFAALVMSNIMSLCKLKRSKITLQTDKSPTIKLIGLDWAVENQKDDLGKEHFTYDEGKQLASSLGMRLPTKDEWELLLRLSNCWDEEKKGIWFAETEADLKNPDKSLFLPANGWYNKKECSFKDLGSYGNYWSYAEIGKKTYLMYFSQVVCSVSQDYMPFNFCVRGIKININGTIDHSK